MSAVRLKNRRVDGLRPAKNRADGRLAAVLTLCAVIVLLLLATVGVMLQRHAAHQARVASYPRHYQAIIEEQAQAFGLPTYLVYAMIRTESSFDPEAESHAGAQGLMQLMPATFEWIAWRLGEEADLDTLTDPGVNIRYGCYLLSYLWDKYESWDAVIAAYNAGDGNVDKWLQNPEYSENGILVKIPFPETENHVKKVRDAWEVYRELYEADNTTTL